MTDFEAAEKAAKDEIAARRNVPDEDGFVLVTRGGRRGMNYGVGGASVAAARPSEIGKLTVKKKELQNFYRFQIREKKRNGKKKIYNDLF